ncbi:MAG: diguanylate cyclase [Defluviitaleaceae bacterium]|nr:diguanylate cyclase [Defluviitaleaceae bacterium]
MQNKKKNSILVVDDERSNISILRDILKDEYTVYAATDGQGAIEAATRLIPDIILLDIIMPEMDGYDVIALLRRNEATQEIPVIFITGLDNTEAEEKGLSMGAADYITKPFNHTIVRLRVKNQIDLIEQFRQQVLMTKISHNFLTDAYIDSLFADTLRVVGQFMDAGQVLLYKFDEENNALVCQSEWVKNEIPMPPRIGAKLPLSEAAVTNIKELKIGAPLDTHYIYPVLKNTLETFHDGLNNYILKPVFVKGRIFAFLDFSRESNGLPWTDNENNLASLIADIFSGVFERDAMERQFSIVENTPDLVLSITAEGMIEYVNPAVAYVTGYTKQEFIAQGFGIIFPKEVMADFMGTHIPNAIRGESVQFEVEIFRKDGDKRILMVSVFQREKKSLGVIFRDMTKIRELEEENEKIFFDGLTGIYNRRFFDETLARLIKSLSRSGNPLSLMMVDVDCFKKYNDTYGHNKGDECLKVIADVLMENVPRADDFVARYGGEEFVVVLPNTNETGARIVAERLLVKINERNIPHATSDAANHVTVSIGITTGTVKHTNTAEDFVNQADIMLYRSKQSGRNKYSYGDF